MLRDVEPAGRHRRATRPFAASDVDLHLAGELVAQLDEAAPRRSAGDGHEPDLGDERLSDVAHGGLRGVAVELAQGHEQPRAHGEHRREPDDREREADPDRDPVEHRHARESAVGPATSGGGTRR